MAKNEVPKDRFGTAICPKCGGDDVDVKRYEEGESAYCFVCDKWIMVKGIWSEEIEKMRTMKQVYGLYYDGTKVEYTEDEDRARLWEKQSNLHESYMEMKEEWSI